MPVPHAATDGCWLIGTIPNALVLPRRMSRKKTRSGKASLPLVMPFVEFAAGSTSTTTKLSTDLIQGTSDAHTRDACEYSPEIVTLPRPSAKFLPASSEMV